MNSDRAPAIPGPIQTTLLELVSAIARETDDDREVVATVAHLLQSGRIRLVGNFRDCDITEALEWARAPSEVAENVSALDRATA